MKTFLHSMAKPVSATSFEKILKKQEKYVEAQRKKKKIKIKKKGERARETIKEYKEYREIQREGPLLKTVFPSSSVVSCKCDTTSYAGKVCGIIARLLSRENRGGRIHSRDIYVLRVIYNCILFSFSLWLFQRVSEHSRRERERKKLWKKDKVRAVQRILSEFCQLNA